MEALTINLRIAESLGWKKWEGSYLGDWSYNCDRWDYIAPDGKHFGEAVLKGKQPSWIPNYCGDLNLMRDVELSLSEESPGKNPDGTPMKSPRQRYREQLCIVTFMKGGPIHASSHERAVAYLKTIENL